MKNSVRLEIKRRTPKGWYGLAAPKGWDDLIEETFLKVLNIYPDLEIHQIKEKFGGLRFYCNVPFKHKAYSFIKDAETRSYHICQNCGSTEATNRNISKYWVATVCDLCLQKNEIGYT